MFLALLLFWIIFNGKVTWEILLVGCVISAALTGMWHVMFGGSRNALLLSPKMIWRYLKYFAELIWEIVVCNIKVMRLILHPSEEIHPRLVSFRTNLKEDLHTVILANSITLTPGTITVELEGNKLLVHGLDASFTEGIEESELVQSMEKLEEAKYV